MGTAAHEANIGLSQDQRQGVSDILTRTLADTHVLYIKTRNYHWNVTGLRFHSLHAMFEEQYNQLEESIDTIAERIRMLGFPSVATMAEYLQIATLKEHPGEYPDANTMVAHLLADHDAVIRSLRNDLETCAEEYNDMGTSDFLTGLMEQHEKTAWMLRATLEP